MNKQKLQTTIKKITETGKGILAADESIPTITKRFEAVGVKSDADTRRDYRELLFTTPDLDLYISGVILFEETFSQTTKDGILLIDLLKSKHIIPGIKVDKGLVNLANTHEKVTQGLDGLDERLNTFKEQGALFAKWRAVYQISEQTPSQLLMRTNALNLARYAAICQSLDIVPIVEPEVLIDGDHTIERCAKVTEEVFYEVFKALHEHKVYLEGIILKPSMVLPGKDSSQSASVQQVADNTLTVFRRVVPCAIPTINFLSGGQTPEQATAHLNAMNKTKQPWNLSFSYARALQGPCLEAWRGQSKNMDDAQKIFKQRAQSSSRASLGQWSAS